MRQGTPGFNTIGSHRQTGATDNRSCGQTAAITKPLRSAGRNLGQNRGRHRMRLPVLRGYWWVLAMGNGSEWLAAVVGQDRGRRRMRLPVIRSYR